MKAIKEEKTVWIRDTVRGREQVTVWSYYYQDTDGWTWMESITKRELV